MIFARLFDFLSGKKALFWLFLFGILAFSVAGIRKLTIREDIFSIFPDGPRLEKFSNLTASGALTGTVVFFIDLQENDLPQKHLALATEFGESLAAIPEGLLTGIQTGSHGKEEEMLDFFQQAYPYLADSAWFETVKGKIHPDSIPTIIAGLSNRLKSPAGSFVGDFYASDPLGLSGSFFLQVKDWTGDSGFESKNGLLYSGAGEKLFITAQTDFSASDTKKALALEEALAKLEINWEKTHPQNKSTSFGTFAIAAANAKQIRKDTGITGIASGILILLLLFWYFRSLLMPVLFLLPALAGGIFAGGLLGWMKGEISIISIATASVLLGIIVDYSFHFFSHWKHTYSIRETVKEISGPLITGSFTTVAALAALCFTGSPVLRDFGLVASAGLGGAALFTLVFLPQILQFISIKPPVPKRGRAVFKLPNLTGKWKVAGLISVAAITVFLWPFAVRISFDSNLNSLSYHPEELKQKEEMLMNIQTGRERKIFVFADDSSSEVKKETHFSVFRLMAKLKSQGLVKSFLTDAPFNPSEKAISRARQNWGLFWKAHGPQTAALTRMAMEKEGLNAEGFSVFFERISQGLPPDFPPPPEIPLLASLGNSGDFSEPMVSSMVVDTANFNLVKEEMAGVKGAVMFDRSSLAGEMAEQVQEDFAFLLWISGGVVFLTMLLVYGRIELTLLSFLPMFISWIWILGFSVLAGIQFNFVNVILITFIFGLGDDFAIFVTDGLLKNYRFGKTALEAYSPAILLSATATIIGLGVLFFAKHPAIHSISALSVIGILCTLILSLVFQPLLFGIFVSDRIKKGKSPVPISEFLFSVFEFTYFMVICLLFQLLVLIFMLIPVSGKRKISVWNRLISFFAGTVIRSDFQVRTVFFGRKGLTKRPPSIYIANHSSFLDILLMIMMNPKMVLMVKKWVYHSPFFGFFIRRAGYVYAAEGGEGNIEKVKELISNGYSLLIFPEGTRSPDGTIQRFHKGAFYLSESLGLPITPVLIHGAGFVLPKNDFMVKSGSLLVKVLPSIQPDDTAFGVGYRERTKKISAFFRQQHLQFAEEQNKPALLWKRVKRNFLYKGPVVEWYVKIKWRLEAENFKFYDERLGNRIRILDAGCGYGYLGFYLHYRNPNRIISGVDYDEEKAALAQACFDKTDHLKFEGGDLRTVDFGEKDAVFYNDVLHYFNPSDQSLLLEKAFLSLQPGGILFIRDGIIDLKEKHKKTEWSEFFSTRVFGFNRKEEDFHFFSRNFIQSFAQSKGMGCEIMEHSGKTSNVLFVLTKTSAYSR